MVALGLAALAAGCQPTKGTNPSFVLSPTTNTDFVQQQIPVGARPTGAAIAPRPSLPPCPAPNNMAPNIAVTNFYDNSLTYLTNDGAGNFTATVLPTGNAPTLVQFADLDGTSGANCSYDLVVTLTSNIHGRAPGIAVLLTTDNVNWSQTTYPLSDLPEQVSVVDMNGDGYPDLVATVPATFQLAIFLNKGRSLAGTFSDPILINIGAAPTRFAATQTTYTDYTGTAPLDLDGDRGPGRVPCADLAVLVPSLNQIYVLESGGGGVPCAPYNGGAFSLTGYLVDPNPFAIVAADLDGDGRPELVTTSLAGPVVGFQQNSGTFPATFAPLGTSLPQRLGPQRMAVARFAGNPPGVAIAHPDDKTISYVAYLGGISFALSGYELDTTPFDLAPGSFTTSGFLDLAVSESTKRIEYIGHGDGAGGFVFSTIGFENIIGSPVVGRLRPGTAQDIVLVQQFNDTLMILRNVNP